MVVGTVGLVVICCCDGAVAVADVRVDFIASISD